MPTARDLVSADRARQVVGRIAEVQAWDAALTQLRSGRGRAIALAGEPGIGKSTLVTHFAARARAGGIPVLSADSAKAGGVVAVLDDTHRVDADDLPAVERLIRAAADAPTLVLLAYRRRQLAPAVAAVISRAVAADLLDVWELGPLSRDEARELVGDLPDLDAVHRAADGNPQYLRILSAGGDPHADAARAIVGELADLDPGALATLQALAVLGEPAHPQLIAAVADLPTAETLDALDVLTRLDLVRPTGTTAQVAVRHPTVAEVIYRRIEAGMRIAVHLRAERVLSENAAPIARRAHHLVRAADPNQPEHTATLVAAARLTLHTAPADAARYLQAALQHLQEDAPDWREAQVLLARACLLTGQASEGRNLVHTLPAMVDHPAGDLTAVAVAGRLERQLGRLSESAAIVRSGLAARPGDDSAAAVLHSVQADNALDQGDYARAQQHADTAAALARDRLDPVGEAFAQAQAALAHLSSNDLTAAETALSQAAELVDAASDAALLKNLEAVYQLGHSENMLSRLADAERHLLRGTTLSRRSGQTYILPRFLKSLADAQARAGSVQRALATLDEAGPYFESTANPATRAILAIVRAAALVWTSSPDAAQQALSWADQAAAWTEGHSTVWTVVVRCRRAEIVLLAGDPSRAGRLLLEAAGGPDLPNLVAARKTRCCDILAEVAMHENDHAAAERWAGLAEATLAQLPSAPSRAFAARARMRVQTMHGDLLAALGSAEQAIEGFTTTGERIEVCRTLSATAALSSALGQYKQAQDLLDRAASIAAQCGATLRPEETARHPLAALTKREREIATLASTGATSVQIAEKLFLSRRTVDAHLGQIYRKLGVSSRAALIRAVLTEL
ncbi:MAG: AAA family ATPase [Catenulispora sp.]|nr:AAA family ATPase [Catenulispora sp.]